MLFNATLACDPQEKGAGYTRLYIIASYMVVMKSYAAGDNQLHESTITSQLELAGTYYNENNFARVIKYHE